VRSSATISQPRAMVSDRPRQYPRYRFRQRDDRQRGTSESHYNDQDQQREYHRHSARAKIYACGSLSWKRKTCEGN
jgi:hypothetical protein